MKPIYLDNHATTQVDPRVFEVMKPYFMDEFGNAASVDHIYGNKAIKAVLEAKEKISSVINSDPEEIIFTSGATESNNLAIFGIAKALSEKGKHIIISSIEHKAIEDPCKELEQEGFQITKIPVDKKGVIEIDKLLDVIRPDTILISIMFANNEIGTIQPIEEISRIAKENNILLHTDAAQAFGHIPIDVKLMNIDLLSISGHKVYGPKGIGALFVKKGTPIKPLILGGGHQKGLRSGTLNVHGIVGLGEAAKVAQEVMEEQAKRLRGLSEYLFEELSKNCKVELNGHPRNRLSHNLNVYFEDIDAKALINEIKDQVAVSTGSACSSDDVKPSRVILALGYDEDRAFSSIRFGLGRFTTEEEIDKVKNKIILATNKLLRF